MTPSVYVVELGLKGAATLRLPFMDTVQLIVWPTQDPPHPVKMFAASACSTTVNVETAGRVRPHWVVFGGAGGVPACNEQSMG